MDSLLLSITIIITILHCNKECVKEEGASSHFKENNLVLSQLTANKIGISRFTKKAFFLNELMLLIIFEKLRPMHSLARSLCHPSSFYSARNKKKSEQEHKGHAILLITVEYNRRQPESQLMTN